MDGKPSESTSETETDEQAGPATEDVKVLSPFCPMSYVPCPFKILLSISSGVGLDILSPSHTLFYNVVSAVDDCC